LLHKLAEEQGFESAAVAKALKRHNVDFALLYIPYMTWLLLPPRGGGSLLEDRRRRAAMGVYVGLDVSLKRTEVCVIDGEGRML
jgi:hypothetical protein